MEYSAPAFTLQSVQPINVSITSINFPFNEVMKPILCNKMNWKRAHPANDISHTWEDKCDVFFLVCGLDKERT